MMTWGKVSEPGWAGMRIAKVNFLIRNPASKVAIKRQARPDTIRLNSTVGPSAIQLVAMEKSSKI